MQFTVKQVAAMLDCLIENPSEGIGLFQYLTKVIRDEFDTRNQKTPSRNEIRQEWFANNFVKRPKLEVKKPEFAENFGQNAVNYLKIRKQDGNRVYKVDCWKSWETFFADNTTLDKKHANIEQPTNRPDIKPAELVATRAEIKRENENREFYRPVKMSGANKGYYTTKKRLRAERKLSIAKALVSVRNPTKEAIARYEYLKLVQEQGFPGLPSHYHVLDNVRYRGE